MHLIALTCFLVRMGDPNSVAPDDANDIGEVPLPVAADANQPGAAMDANQVSPEALPAFFTLHDAITLFHQRGFDLLLADINVDSSAGALQAAGAVNNPQVGGSIGSAFGYKCQNPGCSLTALGASLSDNTALFDILSGKRGLRVSVAKAALEAARQSRDDARRTLEYAVKAQYLAVAIDKANLAFANQVQSTYARTARLFTLRYNAGAVSEADLARIETEAMEAEQGVDTAQLQLQQDKIGLAFLLGVRGLTPDYDIQINWLEKAGTTLADSMSVADLLVVAKAHRPDLMAQASQKERAEASVDLAYRQRFPDIALSLNYNQQGTGEYAISPPTLSLGLTLTLPLFYQYQGEVQQAIADLHAQTILWSKLEAQVASDVALANSQLQVTRSKLTRMRQRLRVRAERAMELVQLQYRKGAASLLDLLDAQRTFIAVNQEYIGDMSDYWTAVFLLEEAVALEFKP